MTTNKTIDSKGYAVHNAGEKLSPFAFNRRAVGASDVLIDIKYCGVCHSDIHAAKSEWHGSSFPMVPGHEIVGIVKEVGSLVKNLKVGDRVGVGTVVGSCGKCDSCMSGDQQFCNEATWTYNSTEKQIGGTTYGGYSNNIVVDERFALKLDPKIDMASTAPLLCAGITTYSPMKRWKVGPGQKVGVVGLGGLGHMAVKFAHSMGAKVVVFTTSDSKVKDALRLGADEVVLSNDKKSMKKQANSFDFIIDTVSAQHDIDSMLSMLKRDRVMVLVGLPNKPHQINAQTLIHGRRILSGSIVGGVEETQEMLDYSAKHGIKSDIELIPIQKINEAYERVLKSDVKYRFVINMESLNK
jgi:uncharacterized zinc-type alcohol dehydrogenase-like protein